MVTLSRKEYENYITMFDGLSNDEIDRYINEHYKIEKYRNILHDRFVCGMLWKDIVVKYYPDYEFASERSVISKGRKLSNIAYRFIKKVVNSEEEEA